MPKKSSSITTIIVVILVIVIGAIIYTTKTSPTPKTTLTSTQETTPTPYSKMTSRELAKLCLPMEGNVMHIHPHLTIMANKQIVTLPAGIGINDEKQCLTSLHTHDASGTIHIESPVQKDFILGDFFAVWDKQFNKNQFLDYKVDANHGLVFYVDGKKSNDFENILLKDKEELFIDYFNLKDGPDSVTTPTPTKNDAKPFA